MKFTYTIESLPESQVAVLAAWTNGDECHVIPSAYDIEHQAWYMDDDGFEYDGFRVYAWAAWPEPPSVKRTEAFWSAVWDVLVEFCKADEDMRSHFLHNADTFVEFRFQGIFAFGGKLWHNNDRIYVNFYPEDETELRTNTMIKVNADILLLRDYYGI